MNCMKAAIKTTLALCILALPFAFRPFIVSGGSMEPVYHEGSVVLVERLTPFLHIARGEVLIFRNPHQRGVVDIKRVIGLPNEDVELSEQGVVIMHKDGTREIFAPETLIGGQYNGPYRIHLGPEDYFVLGDNRSKSTDSRNFGAVQMGDIIGHVCAKIQ